MEYGATVTNLWCSDREGNISDVLLGCPTPQHHLKPHPHFNCIVGRYANRITNAKFRLDGRTYYLAANIPPHHLHGGTEGFANRVWRGTQEVGRVIFRLDSRDGEQGYPGNLFTSAIYSLHGNTLRLEINATTDAPTPVSLSAHHYFNLSGKQGTSINDHRLTLNADHYLPVSEQLTQLGQIEPVSGSVFDLRSDIRLAEVLNSTHPQIRLAGGVDHNFVVNGEGLRQVAQAYHPESGRQLTVSSNQPGVQLYTSNTLHAFGKNLARYENHQGFCLETQQFPDAPNHSNYPDAILRPDETYHAVTEYELSTI